MEVAVAVLGEGEGREEKAVVELEDVEEQAEMAVVLDEEGQVEAVVEVAEETEEIEAKEAVVVEPARISPVH